MMRLGRALRMHITSLAALLASACGSSASTSNAASVGDAGESDARSTVFGAPCVESRACASGVCLPFTSNVQGAPGICSVLCASGADCSGVGACIPLDTADGGACFPTCSAAADCAGGLPCVWSTPIDGGLCQPLSVSFCNQLSLLGDCQQCIGASCCREATGCTEDIACGKLESQCSKSTPCANSLQSSGNAAGQALGACVASNCAVACQ